MSSDTSYRGRSNEEVLADLLKDPEFRAEWERLTLPRMLGLFLLHDRIERELGQTAYARFLGMSQPAYARLEIGEHIPTIATLKKLADVLGVTFRIDIRPDPLEMTRDRTGIVELWPADDSPGLVATDRMRSAAD